MKDIELKILFKLLKVIKTIVCIIIIGLFPFYFPLIVRFFIHLNIYDNVEEFYKYLEMFYNTYFIVILTIGAITVILLACNKEKLSQWITKLKLSFKIKDTQIDASFNEAVEQSGLQKNFTYNFKDSSENNEQTDEEEIISEVQAELQINKNKEKKQKKENNEIKIIKEENCNLRFFATYNIINKKTKELLNIIYCDKSMKLKDFRQRLECSYIDRNRNNNNISKKDLKKYASNKYESILGSLLYLKIVEITDDNDESIALTQNGKEFVEKYIEDEVRDYGN